MIILLVILTLLTIALSLMAKGKYVDFGANVTEEEMSSSFKKILPLGLSLLDLLRKVFNMSGVDSLIYPKLQDVYGAKSAEFQLRLLYGKALSFIWVTILVVSGMLAMVQPAQEIIISDNIIDRPEFGAGTAVAQIYASIKDGSIKEKINIQVLLPEREPTEEEALASAVKWLRPNQFLGKNTSIQDIRHDLKLPSRMDNHEVQIQWSTDNPNVIQAMGAVTRPAYGQEDIEVRLTATLQKGNHSEDRTFVLKVTAITFAEMVDSSLITKESGIQLPVIIGDQEVHWVPPSQKTNYSFPLLAGLIMMAAIVYGTYNELQDKHKKRTQEIQLDFPDFLSKLVLLIGAGLSIQKAWIRVAEGTNSKRPLYVAVRQTAVDMANNVSVIDGMEDFSLKLRLPEVSKFASMVIQNVRRGDQELLIALRQLSQESWQGRKAVANKLAQEASTKLLLPMMLMLFAIIILVLTPAGLSVFRSLN